MCVLVNYYYPCRVWPSRDIEEKLTLDLRKMLDSDVGGGRADRGKGGEWPA